MAGISLRDAEAARLQITREQAAEVQGLYRSVYREYRKQLKSLTSGGATTSLRKAQLKKLTEELKTAYESLGRQLEGNITSAVTQTSQAVVQANNSWMSDIGLNITGAYAHVPQDIVTLLSSGKLYSDGWTLSKAIWGESQQKAHEIDLIVAKGVAANKSAFEIAKDLESYVNPGAIKPWDWSKVYPGTSKKVDYNAQRLARTMVSHAYQQSLERVCNKNPFVIGYKWRSAHTARTCEICNQRSTEDHHGLGPGVYPKGELPLDHPNGMCTFLTVMSDDLMGISNRLADWANGGKDPALDQWYNAAGGKPENKPVTKQEKKRAVKEKTPSFDAKKFVSEQFRSLKRDIEYTFGTEEWTMLEKYLVKLDEERLTWLASGKDFLASIQKAPKYQAYYRPGTRSIFIDEYTMKGWGAKAKHVTFFHEYGHMLDYCNQIHQTKKDDIYNALKLGYNRVVENGKLKPEIKKMLSPDSTSGAQDIINGMSGGNIRVKWGHDTSYWKQDPKGQPVIEALAHFNQAYIMGGKAEEAIKGIFPEAYDIYLQEVKRVAGKT